MADIPLTLTLKAIDQATGPLKAIAAALAAVKQGAGAATDAARKATTGTPGTVTPAAVAQRGVRRRGQYSHDPSTNPPLNAPPGRPASSGTGLPAVVPMPGLPAPIPPPGFAPPAFQMPALLPLRQAVQPASMLRQHLIATTTAARSLVPVLRQAAGGAIIVGRAAMQLPDAIGRAVGAARTLGLVLTGVAAGGLYAFKRLFLGAAADAEIFRIRLEGIEQAPGRAEAALAWTRKFKEGTNATLDEVRQAYIDLRLNGINPVTGALQRIADASVVSGLSLERATKIVTDAADGKIGKMDDLGIQADKVGNMLVLKYEHLGRLIQRTVRADDRTAVTQALFEVFFAKFDGAAAKAAKSWDGMWSNMLADWNDFVLEVMQAGLFDWLKSMLADLRGWVAELRASGGLQQYAKEAAAELRAIGTAIVEAVAVLKAELPTAIRWVRDLVAAIGDWRIAALAVVAVLTGPLLAALAPIIWIVARMVIAIGVSLAPAIAKLAVGLTSLLIPAIMAVTRVVIGFGLALLTTPVGWIILAIAAIAAAVYLIWDNWDWIREQAGVIWDWIAEKLGAAAQWIEEAWSGVSGFFSQLWADIVAAFDRSIGYIVGRIEAITGWIGRQIAWVRGASPQADGGRGGGGPGAAFGGAVGRAMEIDNRVHIRIDAEGRPSVVDARAGAGGAIDLSLGYAGAAP